MCVPRVGGERNGVRALRLVIKLKTATPIKRAAAFVSAIEADQRSAVLLVATWATWALGAFTAFTWLLDFFW